MSKAVFPSNAGWITPRSESGGQITTQNSKLVLDKKIESISKVLLKFGSFQVNVTSYNGGMSEYLHSLVGYSLKSKTTGQFVQIGTDVEYLDITDYIVEYSKWQTLVVPRPLVKQDTPKRTNCFYYEHGGKEIIMVSDSYRDFIADYSVWGMLVTNALLSQYEDKLYLQQQPTNTITMPRKISDLRSAQFRIYYEPIGESVNLETVKTNPQPNEFTIPYSQKQHIVNNVTMGREMQSLTNRMGCETQEVVRTFTDFRKFRKPGAFCREKDKDGKPTGNIWRLTKVQLQIFSDSLFRVMETWSKNWTLQSENVPINREFRSWDIPADIVQRNLHWNDYCLITTKADLTLPDDEILSDWAKEQLVKTLHWNAPLDKYTECSNMWVYYLTDEGDSDKEEMHGVVLTCSAFGFGNSLVFSGKTKDNLSAGVQRVKSDDKDSDYQFCKDVYYCNENGKMEGMRWQIGPRLFTNDTLEDVAIDAVNMYPECKRVNKEVNGASRRISYNGMYSDELLFKKDMYFRVLKDPSEQLNFTYQLHLMTDSGLLVIGPALSANNPLVSQKYDENNTTNQIKVWRLKQYLPNGTPVMTDIYGSYYSDSQGVSVDYKAGTVRFDLINDSNYVGVCITDKDNNVLLAYNDNAGATFYFKFTHFYKSISKALNPDD